MKSIETNL